MVMDSQDISPVLVGNLRFFFIFLLDLLVVDVQPQLVVYELSSRCSSYDELGRDIVLLIDSRRVAGLASRVVLLVC